MILYLIPKVSSYATHSSNLCLDLTATYIYNTVQQNIYLRDIIMMSLVLVHASYLFCKLFKTPIYYGTLVKIEPLHKGVILSFYFKSQRDLKILK